VRTDPEGYDAPHDVELQPLELEEDKPDKNDVEKRNAEGDKHIL
jgi:hypothetical protein